MVSFSSTAHQKRTEEYYISDTFSVFIHKDCEPSVICARSCEYFLLRLHKEEIGFAVLLACTVFNLLYILYYITLHLADAFIQSD